MTNHDVKLLAEKLGGRIDGGINWTWAIDFPSEADAYQFEQAVSANGYETRGIYPANNLRRWNVRYR